MSMHAFNLFQTKLWFELLILARLPQTIGCHLLCLFSPVYMLICTMDICSSSVIFVWSDEVIFSEK